MTLHLNKREVYEYIEAAGGSSPKSALAKVKASQDISPFTHDYG